MLLDPNPGGGGGGGADWRESLPPEYKADAALKDVPDVTTLAKNYINTKSLVGRSVALPGENATPEERSAFYAKLGRPEKPEQYEGPKDFKPHKALQIDNTQLDGFRKTFHELGIPKKAGERLIADYLNTMNTNVAAMEQAREQETQRVMAELDKEWGTNKDGNIKIALQAVERFGGTELKQFFDETGIGNNPVLIKMFHKIGTMVSEDRSAGGGGSGGNFNDPASAAAEIDKLGKDEKFTGALYNRTDPGHAEAVKKWQDLHKVAFPGQQVG